MSSLQTTPDLPDRLLDLLGETPLSGAALARQAKETAPRVRRTLARMQREGLVLQENGGWRRWTLAELYEQAAPRDTMAYRLTLTSAQAHTVQRALELLARLGMGQLAEVFEPVRWGSLRRPDGSEVADQEIPAAEEALQRFKDRVVGLPASGYGSTGSSNVPELATSAWQAAVRLRHRLAWDAEPAGALSTWFDEPLQHNVAVRWCVTSQGPRPEKELRTHLVFIDMNQEGKALLEQALDTYTRIGVADYQVLVELALKGGIYRSAYSPTLDAESVVFLEGLLREMRYRLLGLTPQTADYKPSSPEGPDSPREILARLKPAQDAAFPAWSQWPALPAGYVVCHHAGHYRLVGPSSQTDGKSYKAHSHSLQTLLYMARNLAEGRRPRNFTSGAF